jgi:hypothetical protein
MTHTVITAKYKSSSLYKYTSIMARLKGARIHTAKYMRISCHLIPFLPCEIVIFEEC